MDLPNGLDRHAEWNPGELVAICAMTRSNAPESLRMTLIIADDHPIVLDGLQALLHESRFEVLAQCNNGEDVLARMDQLKPDVLVLDLKMQPVSGLEILHMSADTAPRSSS